MNKKILISCDEQGVYSVGEMGGMEGMDGGEGMEPQMQPADNLDAALNMAREMLSANPEGEAQANAQFEGGYKQAGGPMGIEGLSTKGMK